MRPRAFLRGLLAISLVAISVTQASRTKCSAKHCCIKRDFTPRFHRSLSGNSTHAYNTPRALHEIENDEERSLFVARTVNSLPTKNMIYDDQSPSAESTTIWRSFKRNKKYLQSPFQIGLRHLTGCTSVVIIGHGGIWAAHIFEDAGGMDPSSKAYAGKLMLSGNKKFDQFANHIEDLDGSPIHGPGSNPEIFIINPAKSRGSPPVDYDPRIPPDDRSSDQVGYADNQREYQKAYEDIYRAIQNRWPLINIREHRYHALNRFSSSDLNRLDSGAEGRILFEYDGKSGGPFEIRLHLENHQVLRTGLPPL